MVFGLRSRYQTNESRSLIVRTDLRDGWRICRVQMPSLLDMRSR